MAGLLVLGEGFEAGSAIGALEAAYARGENDEFVKPTIVTGGGTASIVARQCPRWRAADTPRLSATVNPCYRGRRC